MNQIIEFNCANFLGKHKSFSVVSVNIATSLNITSKELYLSFLLLKKYVVRNWCMVFMFCNKLAIVKLGLYVYNLSKFYQKV